MTQITVDPTLVEATAALLRDSPDYLVDMGLLMHVLCRRRFGAGPGSWWADVPVGWLARQSHMSFRRVAASLERLETAGLLIAADGNDNAAQRGATRRYKLLASEKEKRQQALADTPKEKMPLRVFEDGKVVRAMVPREYAVEMPVCPRCGERYDSMYGSSPDKECCVACYIQEQKEKGARSYVAAGKVWLIDS